MSGEARLALVVPCYDEEGRLPAADFLAWLEVDPRVDFVLVDDGSKDGTLSVLEDLARQAPDRVQVVALQPNGGKAEAVRAGLRHALTQPEYGLVGYFDADLATPLDALPDLLAPLSAPHVDICMGARVALLGRDIRRSPARHYAGRVFATVASVLLGLPVYDTQCGAKLFKVGPELHDMLAEPFSARWTFDVELIARYLEARPLDGAERIVEVPLRAWRDVGESKVKPLDFVRSVFEMARIARRYRRR